MDERTDTAANACAACKKYKRKCNKALPSCSTCLCLHRTCNYSDVSRSNPEEDITLLRARVEELEKQMAAQTSVTGNRAWLTPPTSTPPVSGTNDPIQPSISSWLFFLDQGFFTHLHFRVEPVLARPPNDIINILNDEYDQPQGMEQLVFRYFDSIHSWMPIIGKTRMNRVLYRSGDNIQADTAFLLSCMKLLLHTPSSGTPPETLPMYRILKAFNLQLEMAGMQSLMVIQGEVLIAVYELGHAIYPAAYITVAQCARQAISLGLHNQDPPQPFQQWGDWEERIRVWWFIVMLDRFVTVGRTSRPLCTEDPNKNTPLPADNEAWDEGFVVAPERLYASSPPTVTPSGFARLAQAFNLLGRVIRHCDDHHRDVHFMLEEMNTLHQDTSALLELTAKEMFDQSYVASAVCFSALIKLHKSHCCDMFSHEMANQSDPQLVSRIHENSNGSYHALEGTSLETLNFTQLLERHIETSGIEKISPFVLHSLYRAAFWISYRAATSGEEKFIVGRAIFDRVLRTINLRWKAAGTYLQILGSADEEFVRGSS